MSSSDEVSVPKLCGDEGDHLGLSHATPTGDLSSPEEMLVPEVDLGLEGSRY